MPDTDHEQLVARRFLTVCPYNLRVDTIESRDPPEPDILCKTDDGTDRYFELTEITDRDLRHALHDATDGLKATVEGTLKNLPSEQQARFNTKYSDAAINIQRLMYGRGPAMHLDDLLGFLLALPDGVSGWISLDARPGLNKLYKLGISRGRFQGPVFDSSRVVVTEGRDRILEVRIREKCAKRYGVTAPIDLLAFFDTMHRPANQPIAAEMWQRLRADIEGSRFERVWVYLHRQRKILSCYPPFP